MPALDCFRAAEQGTIFLDEIGEMELPLQAKLLRVLQQRTVVPVGGHEEIPIDARVLAATNRDLADEVRSGSFREDLYYRLNVVQLNSVPLCDRTEDIPVLAEHFLDEMSVLHGSPRKRLSDEALAVLTEHSWPGNVRQLQNFLERLSLFSSGETITKQDAISCFRGAASSGHVRVPESPLTNDAPGSISWAAPSCEQSDDLDDRNPADAWFSLEDLERKYIELTLQRTDYNQSAAAELLQIDRSVLRRRIAKFDLDLPSSRRGRPRKPR